MDGQGGYLPRFDTREHYVDFLEGYALPTVDELGAQVSGRAAPTRKLVKTYMLETVGQGTTRPDLDRILPEHVHLHQLDPSLYRVHDALHQQWVIGLLEILHDRHPVIYTTLPVKNSDEWMRQVVDFNPWLDRLWLSSPILFQLWQYAQGAVPPDRYVRLGFDHEAWYESSAPGSAEDSDDELSAPAEGDRYDDEAGPELVERRRSRVRLTERISVLQWQLPRLIELYDPLHSLTQLQLPSGGRGGHLLYHNGKSTNRSDSFLEHRARVAQVLGLYRRITEHAEELLWVDTSDVGEDGFRINGAPLLIEFQDRLTEATFDRFVTLALQRKTSRFRIGGYVTRRGPTKVHLAAIDRHLWQPFLLEATDTHLLAILPRGTCGNTIHRLVTNVQRFLDPNIRVWLGGQPYEQAVENALRSAA